MISKTKQNKNKKLTPPTRALYTKTRTHERGERGATARTRPLHTAIGLQKKNEKNMHTRTRTVGESPACSARARVRFHPKPLYNQTTHAYIKYICSIFGHSARLVFKFGHSVTPADDDACFLSCFFSRPPLGIGIRMAMSSNVTIQRAFGSPRSRAL